jgi:NADPH2:quinone reductase
VLGRLHGEDDQLKAICVHEYGGPEVLLYEDIPEPHPEAGEALVRLDAAGVNYVDVYQRTGAYARSLPFVPGLEGGGTVLEVGAGVTEVRPGDRVAYSSTPAAYASMATVPALRLVPLPAHVDTVSGAAVLLQGLTAHALVHSTYALAAGEWALVHAAAGGVGLLLLQMAKQIGARVIGTVSSDIKAALAREAGAEHVIIYTRQDFVAEVKRLTGGRGVPVVYDSVGRSTFDGSLDSLAPRGTLVLCGQASGAVPPLDPQILGRKGSLYLTRMTLGPFVATREELLARANDLFARMGAGRLRVHVDRQVPLAQAADAHRALEARETAGKILLIP